MKSQVMLCCLTKNTVLFSHFSLVLNNLYQINSLDFKEHVSVLMTKYFPEMVISAMEQLWLKYWTVCRNEIWMNWNLLLNIQYYRNICAYHRLFDKRLYVNNMYLGCYLTNFKLTLFCSYGMNWKKQILLYCTFKCNTST